MKGYYIMFIVDKLSFGNPLFTKYMFNKLSIQANPARYNNKINKNFLKVLFLKKPGIFHMISQTELNS